jgi:hypothetical protein
MDITKHTRVAACGSPVSRPVIEWIPVHAAQRPKEGVMQQQSVADSYDSPWKEGLDRYFPYFMAFFFPDAYAEIDWNRGHENLEKELRKVVRDSEVSRRRADRLTKVWQKSGEERYVLVHTEIMADRDASFAERMFVYNYRTFDRYRKPVVSLAVLGDDSRSWRPDQHGWDLWGCRMALRFPVVKLIDYKERWQELVENANPFAIVVMAHIKTKETHGDPVSRLRWKIKLVRMLYERRYQRQHVLELFRLLDWMMVLPDEEEQRFQEDLMRFEAEVKMPYITSIERRGIEQGLAQGLEQGLEQGIQRGAASLLKRQLAQRFGEVPAWVQEKLDQASQEELELWGTRILEAEVIEDVFSSH